MKALFFGLTAVLACPAIVLFLLVSWSFWWFARDPSLPWMLAAITLSAWCVFVVKILASNGKLSANSEEDLHSEKTRGAADKIAMMLVAVGILWLLFLGFSTKATLNMFRTTGIVDNIENGRAEVTFTMRSGNRGGYDFPEFDNFSSLHAGQSVSLLQEGKTVEVASRAWVFTALGTVTGALLVFGGLFANHQFGTTNTHNREPGENHLPNTDFTPTSR